MTIVTSKSRTAALIAAILAAVPAAAQAQAEDAATRIGAYDDAIVAVMKAKLPLSGRIARFEPLVRASYDMPAIAALVVGPGWATTSAADKAGAIAALTRHSALSLARNFTSYDGTRFVVDPKVTARGPDRVAKVTIGDSVLFYRMRASAAGGLKIIDVISGGVSQLALQRADLAGTVAQGGAAALVRRLAELDAVK